MDIVVTSYPDYRTPHRPEISQASSTGDSYNPHNKYSKRPPNTCRSPKGDEHSPPGPAAVVHDMRGNNLPPGEWVVLTYDRFLNLRYTYVER